MTYTYDLATDRGKVRLWVNDTDTTNGKLTDAEIDYCLTEKTTVGGAVVMALELLMAKVTDPNFSADWLSVSNDAAYKSLSAQRLLMCQKFGVASLSTNSVHTYRADSWETDSPDFSDLDDEGDE
jgi:hypothetical protein